MVTLNVPLHSSLAVSVVVFALNPIAACYVVISMMWLALATAIGLSVPPLIVGRPLQDGHRLASMEYMTALLSTVACVVLISNVSDPASEPEHHSILERSWLVALMCRIVLVLWGAALVEFIKTWVRPEAVDGGAVGMTWRGMMQLARLVAFGSLVAMLHVAFVFTLHTDVRVEEVDAMGEALLAAATASGGSDAAAFSESTIWTHRVLCNVLIVASWASILRTLKPLLVFLVVAWTNGWAAANDGSAVWHIGAEFMAELWRSLADLLICFGVISVHNLLDADDSSNLASGGGPIPLLLQIMIVYRFYNVLIAWSANTAFSRLLDLFELRPPTSARTLDGVEDASCIICLSPLGCRQTCVLPCRHQFHSDCVQSWLVFKRQCPVCRDDPWRRLLTNLRREADAEAPRQRVDASYDDARHRGPVAPPISAVPTTAVMHPTRLHRPSYSRFRNTSRSGAAVALSDASRGVPPSPPSAVAGSPVESLDVGRRVSPPAVVRRRTQRAHRPRVEPSEPATTDCTTDDSDVRPPPSKRHRRDEVPTRTAPLAARRANTRDPRGRKP